MTSLRNLLDPKEKMVCAMDQALCRAQVLAGGSHFKDYSASGSYTELDWAKRFTLIMWPIGTPTHVVGALLFASVMHDIVAA